MKFSSLSKQFTDLRKRYKKSGSKKAAALLHKKSVYIAIVVGLAAIALYVLVIGTSGFFIYHQKTNNRWTHFVERLFPYPAAVVEGQVISLQRFRLEVDARLFYANAHNLPTNQQDTEQFVMDKLMNNILFAKALKTNKVVMQDSDVDAKLTEIYKQVGGQDKLAKFLRENYGPNIDLTQFRTWIQESLVESAVQNQLLTHAKIRHILVSLPENPTDAQVVDAKNRITDIRTRLIADPSQFAALAKQYSEDISSRDKGGELGTTVEGGDAASFSVDFEKAVFSLPVGQLSEPTRSRYGWHLIIVDERTGSINMSLQNYTKKLRSEGHLHQFYSI